MTSRNKTRKYQKMAVVWGGLGVAPPSSLLLGGREGGGGGGGSASVSAVIRICWLLF